jgi:hypothetical protein
MISLSMIFNKITGFYGLLAVLTGFRLSPLQLSMYIYSVGAVVLLAFLMPHIRKQSPFECLALAWFYLIDTVVNTGFTAAFAGTWFLTVSASHSNQGIPSGAPGVGTIDGTAGFTSPKYNVSKVDVIASPAGVATAGQDAVVFAAAGGAAATAVNPSLSHGVGIEEGIPSLMVVVVLTLIRVYFILVAMAYARQVLRQHLSSTKSVPHMAGSADELENPFDNGSRESEGWRGKVGRIMVSIGKGYWLGGQVDDDWAKGLDGRFRSAKIVGGPSGTLERERRARSGTGPPLPSPSIMKL